MARPFNIEVISDIGNFVSTYAADYRANLTRPRAEMVEAVRTAIRSGPGANVTGSPKELSFRDGSIDGQLSSGGTYFGATFQEWPKQKPFGNYTASNRPMRRSESAEPGSSADRRGATQSFRDFWLSVPIKWSRNGASITPNFGSGDGVRFRIYQQRRPTRIKTTKRSRAWLGILYGVRLQPDQDVSVDPRNIRANRHMARHVEFVIAQFALKYRAEANRRRSETLKKRFR